MTCTEVVLVRKKDIMEPIDSDMLLIGRIEVEPVPSQSMIIPLWVANLYSAVISKIEQLEYAVPLEQLNQRPLDEDYPGLISQYQDMLSYQHRLFDHAVTGTQQTQSAPAAEQDQIRLDTTAFTSQVQGALTCLEQALSDAYDQLRQAWIVNANKLMHFETSSKLYTGIEKMRPKSVGDTRERETTNSRKT